MASTIDSSTLPTTIDDHGTYRYFPNEVLHDNGAGDPVVAPYSRVEWRFDIMSFSDFDWITDTLLSGAPSAHFTQATLYDDNRSLQEFVSCVVRRPTHDGIANGWYNNVVWNIDFLMV